MNERTAEIQRTTRETSIRLSLNIDGGGNGAQTVRVATGLGFLDHMITALATHARFDLTIECTGDVEVDDHHTVEDCALALGAALDKALGERRGFARFGEAFAPLDEALARAVVDVSSRPHAEVRLDTVRPMIGEVACENLAHFFRSLAVAARMTLHVDVIRGENDHHKVEAAFKATALALRRALARDEGAGNAAPSTKGVLS